jgi:SAM-dependent MidA family methyltransferase
MPDDVSPGDPRLLREIRREIRERGPLSFARYMELALHHPAYGYYAAGPERLGPQGDYFTASDLGPAFGRCVAAQLVEMDAMLGRPDPFVVIEHGGGRGLLARDVLDAASEKAPGVRDRLRYVVVETSPGMRRETRRRVPEAEVATAETVAGGGAGCVLAVELFDALPVHRVVRRARRVRELFVDLDERDNLVEREGDPLPATTAAVERYGAVPDDGDAAEVCPVLGTQLARMASALRRGFLIVVDYGHDAAELYGPRHRRGTLLAYHRHRTNEEFLARVGRQDLTAHVNLTALEDAAREQGLEVVGRTTQDRFLIAHRILEPFDEPDAARWSDPVRVRERLRIRQLIHPQGMGRMFHVLVLSKDVRPRPDLTGLRDPFAIGAQRARDR